MDEQKKYEVIKGRKPANTIPEPTKAVVINLYRNKYFDANFTHYTELLGKYEKITISSRIIVLSLPLKKEFPISR